MTENVLTVDLIARLAVEKAGGSRRKAAKAAGVSRNTLDKALAGNARVWPRTLGKLTAYALAEESKD